MYTLKLDIGSWDSPVLGGGYIVSNCIKDGVTLIKERNSNFRQVVRIKVNGEFLFYNIPAGVNEFSILKGLLDIDNIFINAKLYYNNDERATGTINLNTGSWDENKNTSLITFQTEDEYTEILKNKDLEYNINPKAGLNVHVQFNSVVYYSTFECFVGNVALLQETYNPDGSENLSGITSSEWSYFDAVSITPCVGTGITYVFATTYATFAAPGYGESTLFPGWWLKRAVASELIDFELRNFIKLYTTIYEIMLVVDNSISVSEATYCTYFTVDKTYLNYVMLADKSNVKRYSSSNQATYENITFTGLMTMMKVMFNLDWTIDENVFKLVRPSSYSLPSFATLPKHDFTILSNGNSITNNQKKYSYLAENKYFKETWAFEQSTNSNFYNTIIDYSSLDENELSYTLQNINNDVGYLVDDPEEANDSGFVFVATSGATPSVRTIINEFVSSIEYVNYKMAALKLVQDHQLIDRSYNLGLINGVSTVLIKRPDKQVPFSNVPIYDINDIDFEYLVKTEVGNVIPESIEIDITRNNFSTFKGVF